MLLAGHSGVELLHRKVLVTWPKADRDKDQVGENFSGQMKPNQTHRIEGADEDMPWRETLRPASYLFPFFKPCGVHLERKYTRYKEDQCCWLYLEISAAGRMEKNTVQKHEQHSDSLGSVLSRNYSEPKEHTGWPIWGRVWLCSKWQLTLIPSFPNKSNQMECMEWMNLRRTNIRTGFGQMAAEIKKMMAGGGAVSSYKK